MDLDIAGGILRTHPKPPIGLLRDANIVKTSATMFF